MQKRIKPVDIYLAFVSILGITLIISTQPFQIGDLFDSVIPFAFLGANLIFSHYMITIPPYGKNISLDSSIYLAIIFLYGLDLALMILLLFSIIFGIWKRETSWWKHIFNFSVYALMIFVSYGVFTLSGGSIGDIQTTNLLPYLLALSSYFITNIGLFIFYPILSKDDSNIAILKEFLKDTSFLTTYFTILLFSIALGILIEHEGVFGLFLFICIAILLSLGYIKYSKLYHDVSIKASKDFLTGLHNHSSFKEELEKEVSIAKKTGYPLSLAIIDLDDFKKYNDSHGHIEGDYLLRFFGRLLHSYSSQKNYFSARYGGEEFAIIMPRTNYQDAFHFVNQFRKKVNDAQIFGVDVLPYECLSFSAGVAGLEKGTYDSTDLLSKADKALYFSKENGKNIVHIYQEIFAMVTFKLSGELEKAYHKLTLFISKDVFTYRHSMRVYQYAVDFAHKLKLSVNERQIFILGALVHDIGKLELPKDNLHKKGKLELDEWNIAKDHVVFGKDIVLTHKEWEDVLPMVELHHERFDGKGYPYGLKGEGIPKLVRILSIINAYDVMLSEQSFKQPKTRSEAIHELRSCAGTQFDPYYVEQFIEMLEKQNEKLQEIIN